jgi:hypothetical protein
MFTAALSSKIYSGFQAVLTEPLPSNGHIRHNIVMYL